MRVVRLFNCDFNKLLNLIQSNLQCIRGEFYHNVFSFLGIKPMTMMLL